MRPGRTRSLTPKFNIDQILQEIGAEDSDNPDDAASSPKKVVTNRKGARDYLTRSPSQNSRMKLKGFEEVREKADEAAASWKGEPQPSHCQDILVSPLPLVWLLVAQLT